MPDCSRFQQIVNDRRAVADTLHATLTRTSRTAQSCRHNR